MRRARSLSWVDVIVVLAGLSLVYWLQVQGEPDVPEQRFLSEKQIDTFGPAPSPNEREAAEAYRSFLDRGGYFASFAKGEDGAYGWADDHTSQLRADEVALNRCLEVSARCEIVVRIRPTIEAEFDGIILSATQARMLDDFRELPKQKALALEDGGAWGAAWNQSAPFEAKQTALAHCALRYDRQKVSDDQPNTCRLVTVP